LHTSKREVEIKIPLAEIFLIHYVKKVMDMYKKKNCSQNYFENTKSVNGFNFLMVRTDRKFPLESCMERKIWKIL
jgi:hypothetical protein